MKKIIFFLLLVSVANISKAQQNTDASRPTAAAGALKAISDAFLPGVFDGVKTILDRVKANSQSNNDLQTAKKQLVDLKKTSDDMQVAARRSLNELKAYYVAESKDFSTINEFYSQVTHFSTQVNTLVAVSDIMTNKNIESSSDPAKNAIITQFRTACNNVVHNFTINERNFISENALLNFQVLNEKRTIDNVIERLKTNDLATRNTFNMRPDEISNYINAVEDIKNNGTYKFSTLETSVRRIEDLLGEYLIDFSRKTDRLSINVDSIIRLH